jgi:hypothetical protein
VIVHPLPPGLIKVANVSFQGSERVDNLLRLHS